MKATPKPQAPRIVSAEFVAAAARPRELPPAQSVEIAFAGRSNVGKSTLLNLLMQRQGLARTSSTPGCTRTVNFFALRTRDGASLCFVDLPGYGFAKRSKHEREEWAELAEGYLLERPSLGLVVLLVDVRRGIEADDQDLLTMVEGAGRSGRAPPKTLVVATKLDRLPRSAQKPALEAVERSGRRVFGVSASDRPSVARLFERLVTTVGVAPTSEIATRGLFSPIKRPR
jgi:GTP-binding protein